MADTITNAEDIIDSRAIIERIAELESERETHNGDAEQDKRMVKVAPWSEEHADDAAELEALQALAEERTAATAQLEAMGEDVAREYIKSHAASVVVARWESRGGRHWVEATCTPDAFRFGGYRGSNGGGNLGTEGITGTIAAVQKKVDAGRFLPDAAKLPMKRVK